MPGTLMMRYYSIEHQTTDIDGKPYFITGDIVELTDDGVYKIMGRASADIIKVRKNLKVYPAFLLCISYSWTMYDMM